MERPSPEPGGGALALELHRLTRHFGERAALSAVSLSLPAGQTLAVLGPNGAGKTTLLRVLGGPASRAGRGGCACSDASSRGNAGRCAAAWVGSATSRSSTASSPPARTSASTRACTRVTRGRVEEVLRDVGMSARADEPLRELSRGMVQRIAAARAVLAEPELLLLDEPHANLDPLARERMEPLIGRESGRTRVIASHDPAASLAEADVVLGLRDGRPALYRSAREVDPSELAALYR